MLDEFGGGAIHACGRVDHFVPFLAGMRGLRAFNMSQPHLNDMEKVLRNTIDQGVLLLGFNHDVARRVVESGRPLHGRVHQG